MPQDASRPVDPREATAELVLGLVAAFSGIDRDVLLGPTGVWAVARVRRTAMDLLRAEVGLSREQVGRRFGRSAATASVLSGRAARDAQADDLVASLRRALGVHDAGEYTARAWAPRSLPGLAAQRRAAGLAQPELAGRAGIARETLSRIERGRRASPETIRRLASALSLPASSLAGSPPGEPAQPTPVRHALTGLADCRRNAGLSKAELARRATTIAALATALHVMPAC